MLQRWDTSTAKSSIDKNKGHTGSPDNMALGRQTSGTLQKATKNKAITTGSQTQVIMCSLYDVYEMNAYGADRVCLSIHQNDSTQEPQDGFGQNLI
jgi:hypothetical protein